VARQVKQQRRGYAAVVLRTLARTRRGRLATQIHATLRSSLTSLGGRLPPPRCASSRLTSRPVAPSSRPDQRQTRHQRPTPVTARERMRCSAAACAGSGPTARTAAGVPQPVVRPDLDHGRHRAARSNSPVKPTSTAYCATHLDGSAARLRRGIRPLAVAQNDQQPSLHGKCSRTSSWAYRVPSPQRMLDRWPRPVPPRNPPATPGRHRARRETDRCRAPRGRWVRCTGRAAWARPGRGRGWWRVRGGGDAGLVVDRRRGAGGAARRWFGRVRVSAARPAGPPVVAHRGGGGGGDRDGGGGGDGRAGGRGPVPGPGSGRGVVGRGSSAAGGRAGRCAAGRAGPRPVAGRGGRSGCGGGGQSGQHLFRAVPDRPHRAGLARGEPDRPRQAASRGVRDDGGAGARPARPGVGAGVAGAAQVARGGGGGAGPDPGCRVRVRGPAGMGACICRRRT